MYRLPPLNSVRAFEAASRHLSFQAAASELSVTPSALSHQIKQLEDFLQVKLFHRRNRAVELTSAGELIRGKVGEGFERLNEAFTQLMPDPDDRTLVVSTGPAFSAKWLAPRIHFFLEENPEIDFRLSANLSLVDFIADGVDVGIRFGGGKYEGLYVEKLFDEAAIPLISPQMWQSLDMKPDETVFERISLLHDDSSIFLAGAKQWTDWFEASGMDPKRAERGSHFSHADHGIEAAVDGAGIILARLGLAWRDIAAGRLIAPFDIALPVQGGFYFVCPEKNLQSEKVLAFLGWLRDEAADQQEAMAQFLTDKQIKDLKQVG
jgi:LysR family glycine cleavage system transcriptional activator